MKAIRLHAYEGLDAVGPDDVEVPVPGAGEVLLRVEAAGVNPVDWKIAEGHLREMFPQALPLTLGCDVSGVVEAVGPDLPTAWEVGEAAFGYLNLVRCGAFADLALARAEELAKKPDTVPHADAAAVPVAALTSWQALVGAAGLRAGESVLVHAAAGGVGSLAVQLAKELGATVIGTASGANEAFVRELGVDGFIDYRATRFEDVARELDVVFDTVGGDTQERSFHVLRAGGRLVSIVSPPSEQFAKQHGVSATMIAVQPDGAQVAEMGARLERGRLRPEIAKTYPLGEGLEALRDSQRGHTRGKLILLPRA